MLQFHTSSVALDDVFENTQIKVDEKNNQKKLLDKLSSLKESKKELNKRIKLQRETINYQRSALREADRDSARVLLKVRCDFMDQIKGLEDVQTINEMEKDRLTKRLERTKKILRKEKNRVSQMMAEKECNDHSMEIMQEKFDKIVEENSILSETVVVREKEIEKIKMEEKERRKKVILEVEQLKVDKKTLQEELVREKKDAIAKLNLELQKASEKVQVVEQEMEKKIVVEIEKTATIERVKVEQERAQSVELKEELEKVKIVVVENEKVINDLQMEVNKLKGTIEQLEREKETLKKDKKNLQVSLEDAEKNRKKCF